MTNLNYTIIMTNKAKLELNLFNLFTCRAAAPGKSNCLLPNSWSIQPLQCFFSISSTIQDKKVLRNLKFYSKVETYKQFTIGCLLWYYGVKCKDSDTLSQIYLFTNWTNPHCFPNGILTETRSPYFANAFLSSSSLTLGSSPPTYTYSIITSINIAFQCIILECMRTTI
jgi:hypothetical protein